MIREFIESWDLFYVGYLEGWLIGVLLALIGVIVVARDQIFIGAAVSQASTVGIAIALSLAGLVADHAHAVTDTHSDYWIHSDSFQSTMAVLFSIMAALMTPRTGRVRKESHEAITGWVFLVSTSLSVLIVSHSPHGLEEIHRIHSSSIIGATVDDVWRFGVLTGLTIVAIAVLNRRLLLFAMDPTMAAAVGMHVVRWSIGIAIWLGLAVGFSIRAAGMLYTFGMLVLPALIAKNVCREVRPMFPVSASIALAGGLAGFALAHHFDYPLAQMTVALLGAVLVLVWTLRGWTTLGDARGR